MINNVDIWVRYGAFLTEKKKGGKDNLKAILRASKVKAHVGVNVREENGRKYSSSLTVVNDERDVDNSSSLRNFVSNGVITFSQL